MNKPPRHIGVVTSARSDFGLLTPLLNALYGDADIRLGIYATGMHFSDLHGRTIDEIRSLPFAAMMVEIPSAPTDDSAAAIGESMAQGLSGFAQSFAREKPDILVVLGDRYDLLPAVISALNFNIPVAHISGGEVTEGVIDDAVRHAITKMSHLHFTAHEDYSRRVVQLGEELWRVTTTGEPGLDNIADFLTTGRSEIFDELSLSLERPVTVLTHHPETLDLAASAGAIAAILDAADAIDSQIVFTYPNADAGSQPIIEAIDAYCAKRPDCRFHASLGRNRYYSLLRHADCMLGNSSSGIAEAPSFRLPVVNIGDRQKGRIMAANIISVAANSRDIAEAWRTALSAEFRDGLAGLENPYGQEKSVERIVSVLKTVPLDRKLLAKKFLNL
jgi:UDP-hydrolysing UDP-N-acetyl-D-glucosamine 2-epimerase